MLALLLCACTPSFFQALQCIAAFFRLRIFRVKIPANFIRAIISVNLTSMKKFYWREVNIKPLDSNSCIDVILKLIYVKDRDLQCNYTLILNCVVVAVFPCLIWFLSLSFPYSRKMCLRLQWVVDLKWSNVFNKVRRKFFLMDSEIHR